MRIFLALLLAAAVLPAAADVYRWTDKDGVVHYTDKAPAPDAKPADLPPLQTFKPDALPKLPAPAAGDAAGQGAKAAATARRAITVLTPADGETIRDGEGKIPTSVNAQPQAGEGIVYTLDGKPQNPVPTPSTAWLMDGVDRGEHQIGATLVDAAGKTLATAPPITVYVMPPSVKR